MRLKRVALYDKECIVIIFCNPGGIPCQEVKVGMSPPLRHYLRTFAMCHRCAVKHHDHRPVSRQRTSANVYHDQIPVGHALHRRDLPVAPHCQRTMRIGIESHVLQRTLLRRFVAIYLSAHRRRTASRTQSLHLILVEHPRT